VNSKNVLVVDGVDGRRCTLAASFRALGWSVWEASTPMEVVRRLADEEAPVVDVLTVPALLHDTPGAALLSFAEDCFPWIIRVLVCDRSDTARLATALDLADVVLQAPWSMFDLAPVVQAVLRRPIFGPAPIASRG
jgi:CheY-like chemotaxis protein